jgi:F-type H+-transporting ATPase subunit b
MRKLAFALTLAAGPAMAAEKVPFFSFFNTSTVTLLAFIIFVWVLVHLKVPGKLMAMLDQRAETIRQELNEAKALREEAQTILASYERKQREVKEQAERIIEHAREEATIAAEKAKEDLQKALARRMAAAEEQIASAQAQALKEVRDQAVQVAVAAASDVLAKKLTDAQNEELVSEAIEAVQTRLH